MTNDRDGEVFRDNVGHRIDPSKITFITPGHNAPQFLLARTREQYDAYAASVPAGARVLPWLELRDGERPGEAVARWAKEQASQLEPPA